jgi:hypothetical protein
LSPVAPILANCKFESRQGVQFRRNHMSQCYCVLCVLYACWKFKYFKSSPIAIITSEISIFCQISYNQFCEKSCPKFWLKLIDKIDPFRFLVENRGTREARVRKTLANIGPAVMNGGIRYKSEGHS